MSNKPFISAPASSKAWKALLAASLIIAPVVYPAPAAHASLTPQPVHDIIALPGERMKLQLKDLFGGSEGTFQIEGNSDSEIVSLNRDANDLQLFFRQPGQATFTVTLNGNSRQVAVNVLDAGTDGQMDIGDLVRYMGANPSKFTDRSSVSTYLQTLAPGEVKANHSPVVTQATYAVRYSSGFTLDVSAFFSDPDGDALDYVVLPASMNGVQASMSGSRLTLTGRQTGRTAFTIYATDPKGAFASIKLLPNTPPAPVSLNASVYSAVYQQPSAISLPPYFFDADGDPISFRIAETTVTGVTYTGNLQPLSPFIDGSMLKFTGQLAGTTNLSLIASDGQYESVPFRLTLNPSQEAGNRPPVGTPLSVQVARDTELPSVMLNSHFSDLDGDPLTYTVSPSVSGGVTASIIGDQLVFNGRIKDNASFNVTATDNHGASVSAAFTYTIENRPPIGTPFTAKVSKNAKLPSVTLATYFSDPDGDALTYTVTPQTSGGVTAAINGGTLVFEGLLTDNASFTVTAQDNQGAKASAVFTYTLENRSPVAAKEWIGLSVHNSVPDIYLPDNFSDPDGDHLEFHITPMEQGGLSALINGSFLSFNGIPRENVSFTVTAIDPDQASASTVYQLTPVNTAPTATSKTFSGARGETPDTLDLTENFHDAEGDPLQFSLSSTATSGGLTGYIDGHHLSFTGQQDGEASFDITATDPMGGSRTVTYTFLLSNGAPVGTPFKKEVTRNSELEPIDLSSYFTDPDGDALTYEVTPSFPEEVQGIKAKIVGSQLQFKGSITGTASFTVRATDGEGLYGEAVFTFTVSNRIPVAKEPVVSIPVHNLVDTIYLTQNFLDPDGDKLTFSVDPSSAGGLSASISGEKLLIQGVPREQAIFTVTATDIHGASVSASYKLMPINNPPKAENQTVTGIWNQTPLPMPLTDNFVDPDMDPLTYSVTPASSGGLTASIEGNAVLSFTGQQTDSASFNVTATDPMGGSHTVTYRVELTNLPPVGSALQLNVNKRSTVSAIQLNKLFTDPEGDNLSYSFTINASGGLGAFISGGFLVFEGRLQTDATFTVTATEIRHDSLPALSGAASISLQAVNQAPVPVPQESVVTGYFLAAGQHEISFTSEPLSSLFSDPNMDPLSFDVSPLLPHGLTAEIIDQEGSKKLHIFGMLGQEEATPEFTVTATDDSGATASLTYQLKPNHAPAFIGNFQGQHEQRIFIKGTGPLPDLDLNTLVADTDSDPLTFLLNDSWYWDEPIEPNLDGLENVYLSGNTLKFEGLLQHAEFRETSLHLYLTATDGKGGVFNFELRGQFNEIPVAQEPEIRVSYLKGQPVGEVARARGIQDNFYDSDNDELYYEVVDDKPYPGYEAKLASDNQDQGRMFLKLTRTKEATQEPPFIPVRVRVGDIQGYAEALYIFQLNQPPVSLLPSSVDVYPDISILNPHKLFVDPDQDDDFTVSMNLTERGRDGENYWLSTTPDHTGFLELNGSVPAGTEGTVVFTATDNHQQVTEKQVTVRKADQAAIRKMPDQQLSTGSTLTLKSLKHRYNLSGSYTFRAFSDNPFLLDARLSEDGQDLQLTSLAAESNRVTLIATAPDGTGFIDQFNVTASHRLRSGNQYRLLNPFGTDVISNSATIESVNPLFSATLIAESDPNYLLLEITGPDIQLHERTTFILRSNLYNGSEGTVYEIQFPFLPKE
ncbi:Ig-like domain-containing protein [Paenibacillus filicis]|uniref:Ig-like domain-containing protein n=1 Tax=Paenibacillus filicis TaxID=669464 RepID=A0ABU9DI43_9BACL